MLLPFQGVWNLQTKLHEQIVMKMEEQRLDLTLLLEKNA